MEEQKILESDLVFTQKPSAKRKKNSTGWEYLGYAGQVGFLVAGPICLGALIGKSLDSSYGWYPQATLSGLGIGFLFSIIGFIQFVREIVKKRT